MPRRVKCDVTAIRDWQEDDTYNSSPATNINITVPPSDLHKHLTNLLWKKQGTDLTLDVAGEAFEAHRWLLAERSPDLLAAAQRFELERLRLMCEEALCKRIDVTTVTDTLVIAGQHQCHALKAACVEFIARPGNLKAITDTKSFDKISPALMMKLAVRQLA